MLTFFTCVVVEPSRAAGTDTVSTEITPLRIGSAIPDELWNLPLEVVNHPEGKEMIKLADYRDKLIILDFDVVTKGTRGIRQWSDRLRAPLGGNRYFS